MEKEESKKEFSEVKKLVIDIDKEMSKVVVGLV